MFQQQALVVSQQQQNTNYHYQMFDMFVNQGLLNEGTNYCLDNLSQDLAEYGDLQTKVIPRTLSSLSVLLQSVLRTKATFES